MMRAVVVPPGEGHRVGNVEFLARSRDTPRFNLGVITMKPHRDGPPIHAHADEDDSFYVLEGELTFTVEDEEVLAPAARAAGLAGPFPADTVFVRAMRGAFDAVIAPYHDVGMTAIKVAAFGNAVNVTLGLPFPRCSPDHGTALDIAGRGLADPSSMTEAILTCAGIARRLRLVGEV